MHSKSVLSFPCFWFKFRQVMKDENDSVRHLVMSNSAIPWPVACQASLSMKFSKQEYWSGLPFTSPGDLPDPGIEPGSSVWQADFLLSESPGKLLGHSFCFFWVLIGAHSTVS